MKAAEHALGSKTSCCINLLCCVSWGLRRFCYDSIHLWQSTRVAVQERCCHVCMHMQERGGGGPDGWRQALTLFRLVAQVRAFSEA